MPIKMPKSGQLSGKPNVRAGWPGRKPNTTSKDGWVGAGAPRPKSSKAGWPSYPLAKPKSSPQSKRRQPKSKGPAVASEKAGAIRGRVAGGNALDFASKAMRRKMKQKLNLLVE